MKNAAQPAHETHSHCWDWVEATVWTPRMLKALEAGLKGNKWFRLIDKVWAERTLERAWEKVRSNGGSPGVDGITIGRFEKDRQSRLLAVKEQLRSATYQPKPVKRVWIDKPGSREKRPLGVPTITDRIVQSALRMVIEPIFEKDFAFSQLRFSSKARMQRCPASRRHTAQGGPKLGRRCRPQKLLRFDSARASQ